MEPRLIEIYDKPLYAQVYKEYDRGSYVFATLYRREKGRFRKFKYVEIGSEKLEGRSVEKTCYSIYDRVYAKSKMKRDDEKTMELWRESS